MISSLKKRSRRVSWLYELVRKRRAHIKEAEYISLREQYYRKTESLFAEPGYLAKSRGLLSKYWQGPRQVKSSPKEVRLFAVGATVVGASQLLPELARSFDTEVFDFGESCSEIEHGNRRLRDLLQKDLLESFRKAHRERPVDLAWLSATHVFVSPETLNEIRRAGVPVAVLNTDDKHLYREDPRWGFPNGQKPLIGAVDVHLTNSLECVRWYMAEGAAACFSPQGVDPEIFKPLPVSKDYDVTFIGAAYGMRRKFIEKLRNTGIRIACFGQDWGTRFVTDDEKIEIFSRSRINLGVGGVGSSDRITCVKGRDIEVPGSGNVLLTLYDAELARLWCVGKEILCYYNEIDCIEQIRYYLERPHEAEAIGRAARERALREHTWTHRLVELLRWMGIMQSS